MNRERRKSLSEIEDSINEIRATLEAVQSEEQDAYDNLPEGTQSGDRGEAMQTAIDAMEEALCQLDEAARSVANAAE